MFCLYINISLQIKKKLCFGYYFCFSTENQSSTNRMFLTFSTNHTNCGDTIARAAKPKISFMNRFLFEKGFYISCSCFTKKTSTEGSFSLRFRGTKAFSRKKFLDEKKKLCSDKTADNYLCELYLTKKVCSKNFRPTVCLSTSSHQSARARRLSL